MERRRRRRQKARRSEITVNLLDSSTDHQFFAIDSGFWIFGAILAAVGLLAIGCSLGHSELGFPFAATGVISSGAGSFIFVTRFRAWIKSLL